MAKRVRMRSWTNWDRFIEVTKPIYSAFRMIELFDGENEPKEIKKYLKWCKNQVKVLNNLALPSGFKSYEKSRKDAILLLEKEIKKWSSGKIS